jgi:hypothetical protein
MAHRLVTTHVTGLQPLRISSVEAYVKFTVLARMNIRLALLRCILDAAAGALTIRELTPRFSSEPGRALK